MVLGEEGFIKEGFDVEIIKPQNLTKTLEKSGETIKYFDRETINMVISNITNPKHKVLIMTMWMTGLRVSEVNNIRKQDVDFEHNTMRVRWLKNRKYYERIIPVKKELSSTLFVYSSALKSDERLFPYTRQHVHSLVKKYFGRGAHPHMLRHSFAINFLRQSSNPYALVVLKELLGHQRIHTTMRYLRLTRTDLMSELEKIQF